MPMYTYRAHVQRVVDGDTILVSIDLGFSVWLQDIYVRLAGIDAPEPRGSEADSGLASSDALRRLVEAKDITLKTYKDETGKYGRYIGDAYLEHPDGDIHVNQWLVDQGWAQPYEGGQTRLERTGPMAEKPVKCRVKVQEQGHGGFILDWRITSSRLGESHFHARYKDLPEAVRDDVLALYRELEQECGEMDVDSDAEVDAFVQQSLATLAKVAERFAEAAAE